MAECTCGHCGHRFEAEPEYKHRVMCGDSTDADHRAKLLDGKKVDLLFTDPPYGVNIVRPKSGGKGSVGYGGALGFVGADGIVPVNAYRPIVGDGEPFDPSFLLELAPQIIIWGGNYFADKLPPSPCWLIWDKREEIPSNNFADCEIAWTNFDSPARIYRHLWSGLLRKGNREEELTNRVHPTQKPVGLHSSIMDDYSESGCTVLDLFLGSGTTLIAAERTGRICYGAEIDPHYCDVILARWEKYTGLTAERIHA